MKLIDYFLSNTERPMIHKPLRYFDIYEKYFARYKDTKCKILEIGVENGGSLQMWKEYLGVNAKVVGIDIDPRCKSGDNDIHVYIGDQMSEAFLNEVTSIEGSFDIIIDDGGHQSIQQLRTFGFLYPRMAHNGIYLVEDIGTSYMKEYGGGYKHPGSFIEYSKSLIDEINIHDLPNNIAECTRGIHFHNGIVVFERGIIDSYETLAIGLQML